MSDALIYFLWIVIVVCLFTMSFLITLDFLLYGIDGESYHLISVLYGSEKTTRALFDIPILRNLLMLGSILRAHGGGM